MKIPQRANRVIYLSDTSTFSTLELPSYYKLTNRKCQRLLQDVDNIKDRFWYRIGKLNLCSQKTNKKLKS